MSRSISVSLLLFFFTLFSLLFLLTSAGHGKHRPMNLQDVTTLVFTKGELTTARRSSPVPQMRCIHGHCEYAPSTAMCRNIGFDGRDVTWKCEAELPKGIRFGKVEVNCEGFASRDDEQVLQGSCGLEYSLEGTPTYREEVRNKDRREAAAAHDHSSIPGASYFSSWWKAAQNYYNEWTQPVHHHDNRHYNPTYSHHTASSPSLLASLFSLISSVFSTIFSLFFYMIAACIVLFIVYRFLCPSPTASAPMQRPYRPSLFRSLLGFVPFAGSMYDAFNQPPPPPYTQQPDHTHYPNNNPGNKYNTGYGQQQAPAYTAAPATASSGTGFSFLHGALGGSLLGYLMGRRRAAPAQTRTETRSRPVYREVHTEREETYAPSAPIYSSRSGESYSTAVGGDDVKTSTTSSAYATTKRR